MPNLYLVEAYEVHDGYRKLVGTEYVTAPSWGEAITEAGPHWPPSYRLRVRECTPQELEAYLEHYCP